MKRFWVLPLWKKCRGCCLGPGWGSPTKHWASSGLGGRLDPEHSIPILGWPRHLPAATGTAQHRQLRGYGDGAVGTALDAAHPAHLLFFLFVLWMSSAIPVRLQIPAGIIGCHWISTTGHHCMSPGTEYRCTSLVTTRHHWVPLNIIGCHWVSSGTEHHWVPLHIFGHHQTLSITDTTGCHQTSLGIIRH